MAQILLLEDDPELRMIFNEYLLRAHHSVQSVGTCNEALMGLKRNTPDVLILDVMIAAQTSLNVAAAAGTLTPPPTVIFVTGGKDFRVDAARKVNVNVQSVLRKPVSMKDLQNAVAQAVFANSN